MPHFPARFADNLKRELPRIPFAPDFPAFAEAGERLAHLHLNYEQLKPYPLEFVVHPGRSLSYRVEDKMRLSKDKRSLVVNPSLTLSGIPPEAFDYRLGNRSALDWVIDQYQVTEDSRTGIRLDPKRSDYPEYIVRLLAQVIHLSPKTSPSSARSPMGNDPISIPPLDFWIEREQDKWCPSCQRQDSRRPNRGGWRGPAPSTACGTFSQPSAARSSRPAASHDIQ